MRTFFAAAIIVSLSSPAAIAQTCQEKFVDLITNVYGNKGPSKIFITQDGKGTMKSKNFHYTNGKDHWMTEMIEPKNMSWTLAYKNIGYTSSDKGKSWKKAFEMNSEQQARRTRETLKKDAQTIRDVACGQEEIKGAVHETIEGAYTSSLFKAEMKDKFWVNKKTGWISKKVSRIKSKSMDSTTVQIIEPAPDLKLPLPQ